MRANKLRIGNHVLARCEDDRDHFEPTVVTGIFEDEIHHEAVGMTNPTWSNEIKNIKPIPLTEEWLFKFGVIYVGSNCYELIDKLNKTYVSVVFYDRWMISIETETLEINYEGFPMVHELQNMFCLTGEELKIK